MLAMQKTILAVVFLPLLGSILTGLSKPFLPKKNAHRICITLVGLSFTCACLALWLFQQSPKTMEFALYEWGTSGGLRFTLGLLVDDLSLLMAAVVTFVSFMVHIYTVGYMKNDPGYTRFFAFIAFFTFAMLLLVFSNNVLQMFFAWEAVGLASYWLIGFWFHKPSASYASLKAFIVNRIADVGFLMGLLLLVLFTRTTNISLIFSELSAYETHLPLLHWVGFGLLVGAMGKSAQVPLHVWLPDSMEGPTPISALIHAATMVTAGVFMLVRFSPILELVPIVLNTVLWIGALTAVLMGLVAIVQNDIKRIIAYSTLSQLGYMMAAVGVSAYSVAIFHLVTHAFFKALLFLCAGAIIIALHHKQDINKMGGLAKKLPVVYTTMLLASLALVGFPGFSGFYSKDLILENVFMSRQLGAYWVYCLLLFGVVLTTWYTFRLIFKVFHGRLNDSQENQVLEPLGWSIQLPLVLLVIPSVMAGWYFAKEELSFLEGFVHAPFYCLAGAFIVSLVFYQWKPEAQSVSKKIFDWISFPLKAKLGIDWCYEKGFMPTYRFIAHLFDTFIDKGFIDGLLVNGLAGIVQTTSRKLKMIQTGYLYHYAFIFVVGLVVLIAWRVLELN